MKPVTSKAFNAASPVILSSQCAVAPLNSASPQMTQLAYPYRKPVLIDEIRFDMWADSGVVAIELGALVYARLQLGNHYLMRDPVPVWLLGTTMDELSEVDSDSYVSVTQAVSHYRWRLPEPLYVEAGKYIWPVFSRPAHNSSNPAGNITVQVSYVGRVVPPSARRPSTIVVPYAAPFVTTFGNTYQQSNEYHLFNANNQPLLVQRMTARVLIDTGGAVIPQQGITPLPTAPTANVSLLIDDSWGGKIVNNLTGPGDVVDQMRAAWTYGTVMPAKGQYNVRVWNIPANTQVHIGMIGSREEAL